MDRYDAILEHLKKAQSQGLDSVATRLDAIVESLGELIQSAKTTVQSARPTDAEEVLPLAEVEALVAASCCGRCCRCFQIMSAGRLFW
jgi:hypothetical protein